MKNFMCYLLLILSLSAFSQSRDDLIKQFRRDHMQMMKQMMDLFQDDFSDDFFKDDIDPFGGLGKLRSSGGQVVTIDEQVKENGDVHIFIKPKKKDIKLEIETTDNMISVKSDMKVEETTKDGDQSFKSYSSSSYQRSIQIPQGYKISSSTAKKDGYEIVLSPSGKIKNLMKPQKNKASDKAPVGRQEDEEMI